MSTPAYRYSVNTFSGPVIFYAEGVHCYSVAAGVFPVLNTLYANQSPFEVWTCPADFNSVGASDVLTLMDKNQGIYEYQITRLESDFDSVGYLLLIAAVIVLYALGFVGGQQR